MGMNRMMSDYSAAYAEMMRLRKERKEFVSADDMGVFYRNQKLLTMIYEGEISTENVDNMMSGQKMSEEELPMEWYYHNGFTHPQEIQCELLLHNLLVANQKRNQRGKVTPLRLKQLLRAVLYRRVDMYSYPEKYLHNKILCIVGESGAGKTLASLHLQNKLGANAICSFTTRPPRETEVEGREHHFINIVPDPNELLAYATFGGYEYYALKTQVFGPCTVYVIDEQGLMNLKNEHGDEYDIYSVYITRKWSNRMKSGIKRSRMDRDLNRMQLPLETYNWVIDNNSTKKNLFINIEDIYNKVKNMQYGNNK